MAIEEEKSPAEQTEAAPAKKGGSKKLVLFGVIGLVCVGLGVGGAIFLTKGKGGSSESEKSSSSKEHVDDDSAEKHAGNENEHSSGASSVYTIKDIVVNPSGTGGQRYLSVSFAFDLGSEQLKTTFEQREPIIRDALITILSSKTVAQLTDAREKEIIRLQVKKRLMQMLKTKDLAGVYYSDFVLQ